jgi:hypothetical protein
MGQGDIVIGKRNGNVSFWSGNHFYILMFIYLWSVENEKLIFFEASPMYC